VSDLGKVAEDLEQRAGEPEHASDRWSRRTQESGPGPSYLGGKNRLTIAGAWASARAARSPPGG